MKGKLNSKLMRKTKIICTLGPASDTRKMIKDLMQAGMNGARLNFSHGTYEEHEKKINLVKEVRAELGLPVSIILDTKGPEIRTGKFEKPSIILKEGQMFTITTRDVMGTEEICSITYEGLIADVEVDDRILIDDGLVELKITKIDKQDLICKVINGGEIKDYKGVNVPGVKVKLPAITDQDKNDIEFGISQEVDFVAASFVRKASDIEEMRWLLNDRGASHIKIIAKIENKEGVDNIDEIVKAADGVMVARGDLGVEIPAEMVPIIQKKIIKKCNKLGKFVITATQMMDSMIRNPRPTRAEVADVANAIFDGTDVVMLSGETAAGKYPVEAVKRMVKIAETTEEDIDYEDLLAEQMPDRNESITNAIGYATCTSAYGLKAKAILTPTSSGYTASVVAKFRPKTPIIAFTTSERTARRLSLVWGIYPLLMETKESSEKMFQDAVKKGLEHKLIHNADLIVITAGLPVGVEGNTNRMSIHIVGKDI